MSYNSNTQVSGLFSGIKTPGDVQNAVYNGTLSMQDALTILEDMKRRGTLGTSMAPSLTPPVTIPPVTIPPVTSTQSNSNNLPSSDINIVPGQPLNLGPSSANPFVRAYDSATGSFSSWISSHIGSYALVLLGGVMIIGALLSANKQTAITLATEAAI
jgi:hypothetical protein